MEIIDFLKNYWQILVGLTGVIVVFIRSQEMNKQQEKRILFLEERIESVSPVLIEIRERLARIDVTLEFLRGERK